MIISKENRKEAINALDSIVDEVIRKVEQLGGLNKCPYPMNREGSDRRMIERHIKPVVYDYINGMLVEIFSNDIITDGIAISCIRDKESEILLNER